MTYNVFSGTLSPAQSINQSIGHMRADRQKNRQTRWSQYFAPPVGEVTNENIKVKSLTSIFLIREK